MKMIAAEPIISGVVIELKDVPTEKKSEYHPPYEIEKGVINLLLFCDSYGKTCRIVHKHGFCGRGMWDRLFSEKMQKELDKIGKIETKKQLKKLPSKINTNKYRW